MQADPELHAALRRRYVERCAASKDLPPVALCCDQPVVIAGHRYRPVYDGIEDRIVLRPEREWLDALARARAAMMKAEA